MDESSGRFSSEAAVKTRLMWTSSSNVIILPCTTCWNSFERTKSSCTWPCIGEPGGEWREAEDDADDDGPEQGNDPDSPVDDEDDINIFFPSFFFLNSLTRSFISFPLSSFVLSVLKTYKTGGRDAT